MSPPVLHPAFHERPLEEEGQGFVHICAKGFACIREPAYAKGINRLK
jgi:hypothetical protein